MAKIRVENLSKVYVTNGRKVEALRGLSLEIKEGEFFGIVGPTGCGKTTLLNLIAGLEKPTEGTILINGREVEGPGFDRGMLFQEGALLPWRNVIKNVEFGLEIKGVDKRKREEISRKYLALVGLEGFEDSYPYELSGGMLQRTALARVLTFEPEILLMDEPFAAVDALTREKLQDEILRIWEKTRKTIVFVTHSIDEIIYLSDRVAVLTGRPARAKKIINIELPRPRREARKSRQFAAYRDEIWNLLKGEVS
jgi:NitT/TauT family transport system ATP-binding protein